jgi:hypothetical protein
MMLRVRQEDRMKRAMLGFVGVCALAFGAAVAAPSAHACPGDDAKKPSLACPGDDAKKPSLDCPGDDAKKPSLACPGDDAKKPSVA